LAYLGLPSR
jgi:hypothetical protein